MKGKPTKTARLVIRASNVADYAAREAVTKFMADYLDGSTLPVKDMSWRVRTAPDGAYYLSGQVDSGTPDADVRAILNDYIAEWDAGKARVRTRTASEEGLTYIEATGLEVDDSPVEVWGTLGYSAGESGE